MPSPRSISTAAAILLVIIGNALRLHAILLPTVIPNTATVWNLENHNPAYTGTIPSELARYTELTQIWFNGNSLSGTLPSELGKLTKMKSYFSMFSNQLKGQIPTQLGKVSGKFLLNPTPASYRQHATSHLHPPSHSPPSPIRPHLPTTQPL